MPKKKTALDRYAVVKNSEVVEKDGEPHVIEWDGSSDHGLGNVELVKLVPPQLIVNTDDLPGIEDQPDPNGPGVTANIEESDG